MEGQKPGKTKLLVEQRFNRTVLYLQVREGARPYKLWGEAARLRRVLCERKVRALWHSGRVVGIVLRPLPEEEGEDSESEWNSDVQQAIDNCD